jgi:hypothetical protein
MTAGEAVVSRAGFCCCRCANDENGLNPGCSQGFFAGAVVAKPKPIGATGSAGLVVLQASPVGEIAFGVGCLDSGDHATGGDGGVPGAAELICVAEGSGTDGAGGAKKFTSKSNELVSFWIDAFVDVKVGEAV